MGKKRDGGVETDLRGYTVGECNKDEQRIKKCFVLFFCCFFFLEGVEDVAKMKPPNGSHHFIWRYWR